MSKQIEREGAARKAFSAWVDSTIHREPAAREKLAAFAPRLDGEAILSLLANIAARYRHAETMRTNALKPSEVVAQAERIAERAEQLLADLRVLHPRLRSRASTRLLAGEINFRDCLKRLEEDLGVLAVGLRAAAPQSATPESATPTTRKKRAHMGARDILFHELFHAIRAGASPPIKDTPARRLAAELFACVPIPVPSGDKERKDIIDRMNAYVAL